ncbi:putative integral membrane protein [Rosellinia necatrix]|uniref:Putative integral membrane protein n=1 Tax=Rosellinia necatrix TaxID=77044 RepID=A0A1W2TUE1_ROSNE|nr:putative integral membrane protein [Rosellinia necatrix]
MALRILTDPAQGAYFILLIILVPVGVAATILRFVATKKSGRSPGIEDWLALGALVSYLSNTILALIALIGFNGRDAVVLALTKPEEYASLQKIVYAALPFFPLQMFFSKASILALYYRVFGVNRTYAWWIYGIFAIHSIWAIVVIVLNLAGCQPVEKNWYPLAPGHCISQAVAAIPEETVNSLIDFAMVILAIVMIRTLQMSSRVKWKLGLLFGLGSLVGVIGFIKLGVQYNPNGQYVYTVLGLWATLQMAAAILCCCAPVYKPLLPDISAWRTLKSWVTRSTMRSTGSQSRPGVGDHGNSFTNSFGSGGPQRARKPGKNNHGQSWTELGESTRQLAWPETHQNEAYALGQVHRGTPETQRDDQEHGIQVQRTVDVV